MRARGDRWSRARPAGPRARAGWTRAARVRGRGGVHRQRDPLDGARRTHRGRGDHRRDVRIRGVAVHASEERRGVNAIEKSYEVMQALRGLEAELNVAPPSPYDRFSHPINLNVGAIRGGDWV